MVIPTTSAPAADSDKTDEPIPTAKQPLPVSPAEPQASTLTPEQLLRMQANREQGAPLPSLALRSHVRLAMWLLPLAGAHF
jgi:hypothetical protein